MFLKYIFLNFQYSPNLSKIVTTTGGEIFTSLPPNKTSYISSNNLSHFKKISLHKYTCARACVCACVCKTYTVTNYNINLMSSFCQCFNRSLF